MRLINRLKILVNTLLSLPEKLDEIESRLGMLENPGQFIFPVDWKFDLPQNVEDFFAGACIHEYPEPWLSINPPACKKCGKQADDYISYTTNTTIQ